jgi:secretion/DNA translocation related TadE-like protein
VVACSGVVVTMALAALIIAGAILARHKAESAADLAAISAAEQLGRSADPCHAADHIASDNGATLTGCSVALSPDGRSGTVTVLVRTRITLPLAGFRSLSAQARAGRARLSAASAGFTPAVARWLRLSGVEHAAPGNGGNRQGLRGQSWTLTSPRPS